MRKGKMLKKIFVGLFAYHFFTFSAGKKMLGELPTDRPLIIAHRGSSGQLPQHTVEAYQLAVEQGADVIECDLAVTKDLQLVCSHIPILNDTTDVAKKFPDRIRSAYVPDLKITVTDYFTIDFTLQELKTLRKVQHLEYRDQSYNGLFAMATFEENIAVAKAVSRTVGIYPETKLPAFSNQYLAHFNTTIEDILVETIHKHGYTSAKSPCFLQSFNLASVKYMAERTDVRVVYLMVTDVTDELLESMLSYVDGIGPRKDAILRIDPATRKIIGETDFMKRVKRYGYTIHPYTFRNEDRHLAFDYAADSKNEYQKFIDLGVDGFFTDFPATLAQFLKSKECEKRRSKLEVLTDFVTALGYVFPRVSFD